MSSPVREDCFCVNVIKTSCGGETNSLCFYYPLSNKLIPLTKEEKVMVIKWLFIKNIN